MRDVVLALSFLIALGAPAGPAVAGPVTPALHGEAGRLVDEVTDQLRTLGARLERHFGSGRSWPGLGDHPGVSRAERPLITIMLHHRSELGLTGEQVGRLEALRGAFAREAIRREAELRVAELDLAALLEEEPLDMTRVEAKVREVAQLRADLRIARLRTIEEGKAVLTPEQRSRLGALLGSWIRPPQRAAGRNTHL